MDYFTFSNEYSHKILSYVSKESLLQENAMQYLTLLQLSLWSLLCTIKSFGYMVATLVHSRRGEVTNTNNNSTNKSHSPCLSKASRLCGRRIVI